MSIRPPIEEIDGAGNIMEYGVDGEGLEGESAV